LTDKSIGEALSRSGDGETCFKAAPATQLPASTGSGAATFQLTSMAKKQSFGPDTPRATARPPSRSASASRQVLDVGRRKRDPAHFEPTAQRPSPLVAHPATSSTTSTGGWSASTSRGRRTLRVVSIRQNIANLPKRLPSTRRRPNGRTSGSRCRSRLSTPPKSRANDPDSAPSSGALHGRPRRAAGVVARFVWRQERDSAALRPHSASARAAPRCAPSNRPSAP
jgi:hypothetical protein